MSWNIAPECVSAIILSIIWVYSRKGTPIPSLKNRLFQACLSITFCAMTTNILSTLMIYQLKEWTLVPTWIITIVYFITTPLMGLVYFLYTFFGIFESSSANRKVATVIALPGIIYTGMVLLTPFTGSIFSLSLEEGYVQGPLRMITYLIFYLYCLLCVILVAVKGTHLHKTIRRVYFSFPLLAALVIITQMIDPTIILSGSAATCSLLLIYLFLQNKQISIDFLTNLPNRQEFLSMLELKIKRHIPVAFSLIVLSLKDFKVVNDTYGQHNGDDLLVAVSRFLKKTFYLGEGQLYRYSGDEFAIILDGASESDIQVLCHTITQRLAQPWEVASCTALLSGGIGIVSYPNTASKMEDLIGGIESSVILAKRTSQNGNICFCNSKILQEIRRKQTIVTLLKEYLETEKFQIYYQPIYSLRTGKFTSAEALLRMNNTPIGSISPGEFIPIAEDSGLIIEITYYVLRQVCRDIQWLRKQGLPLESVNVNFSSLQFAQRDLGQKVEEIITQAGLSLSSIKIELTESTLADNPQMVTDFALTMGERGLLMGLDDFGTGFSNLTSVTHFPWHTVKLDKSLVWAAMGRQQSAIVVRNLTRAFRELGIQVLAEGVETAAQSDFVEECGCTLIQGFFYARPMPLDAFAEFVEERNRQTA